MDWMVFSGFILLVLIGMNSFHLVDSKLFDNALWTGIVIGAAYSTFVWCVRVVDYIRMKSRPQKDF